MPYAQEFRRQMQEFLYALRREVVHNEAAWRDYQGSLTKVSIRPSA